ncbi:MAG: hypothetical protein EOT05_00045 [Candidatus Microsaccharimonas sossegonensis]|uniref:Uncharacterized protein n=1 Tax=Candidatus Microsaccharimonas sossegonensis TaxID=2506948 RepID=A0A4V1J7C0_9BACT|nr:MAG: hypothetical protein EOT05_00045 [Candidatus Microsaccharimonas sossegonensis]
MKLVEAEPLAKDLEKGLGEVHDLLSAFNPEYRLSMGICGIVTVALSEKLDQLSVEHHLVETTLEIDSDYQEAHDFIILEDDTILDATYTSLYKYVGLTAGYLSMSGRGRLFPKQKIVTLPVGEHELLARQMGLQARYFMDHYIPIDEVPQGRIIFEGKNEEEIAEAYAPVWDPENFSEYAPSKPTIEIGTKLAQFIVPEHIKLVA